LPAVRYYPVYLDLSGRSCLVIGGDQAAEARVTALLAAGARVTVISPELTPALAALAETHEIVHHPRAYRAGDLREAVLVHASIADEEVGEAIAAEADERGVWLNVIDKPRLCRFITPAVVQRGPVAVAISTGGASPALARRLRQDVERAVGPEYGLAATILGRLRPIVAGAERDPDARARIFGALADSDLLCALRARDAAAVDAILSEHVGKHTSLAALGVSLGDDHGNPAP
jgi:precorrin-2 dehydrogenase/sirohydrochlorin ferrochelatase